MKKKDGMLQELNLRILFLWETEDEKNTQFEDRKLLRELSN